MKLFLPCLYAFIACLGFCAVFNIHGKIMLYDALGGALGWFAYLITSGLGDDILRFLVAAVVISVYAEVMARMLKAPVTGFLLVAILPLVPGGGIYYTMEYCISGDTAAFVETGLHTFGIAGVLAVGVLLVSSSVRLLQTIGQTVRDRK